MQILIVEDNPNFCDILKATLQSSFPLARVSTAPEGHTALCEIEKKEPDLVFTDIRMPGMSGLTLTGEIRRRNKNTIILVLTNLDTSEYREAAFAKGADFFLSKKSVGPEELQKLIARIVADRLNRGTQQ